MRDFLLRFTEDPIIHRLFAIFSFLACVIPYTECSAGELLWIIVNMLRNASVSYPRGGTREIANSNIRAFIRDGGKLRTGCEVKRIIVKDGKACGVETSEGEEIQADVIISNTGIKRTVDLAGEKHFPEEYVSYVRNLKYSDSAIMVKLGIDCQMQGLYKNYFQFVPEHEASHMAAFISERRIPNPAAFAYAVPTDWDPNLAPLGKQIIVLGTMGPSEVTSESTDFCNRILDATEKEFYNLFPKVKEHVQWKILTNVAHTAAITGKPTGECIGLSQCVGQTGVKKPSPITPVKNLWLVGTDAGARGIGTEQAALSALYVANLLG